MMSLYTRIYIQSTQITYAYMPYTLKYLKLDLLHLVKVLKTLKSLK